MTTRLFNEAVRVTGANDGSRTCVWFRRLPIQHLDIDHRCMPSIIDIRRLLIHYFSNQQQMLQTICTQFIGHQYAGAATIDTILVEIDQQSIIDNKLMLTETLAAISDMANYIADRRTIDVFPAIVAIEGDCNGNLKEIDRLASLFTDCIVECETTDDNRHLLNHVLYR